MITLICPTADCGGSLSYRIEALHDGDGPWSTFRGFSAELVAQDCACVLTPEQVDALEATAVGDWLDGAGYDDD